MNARLRPDGRLGVPERRPGASARRTLAAVAAAALASVVAAVSLERSADAREAAARALRVETQALERRLHRLAAPGADATLAALGESRDALRVRLVEALDRVRGEEAVGAFRHRVEELAMGEGGGVATLRLTIEGRVAHGAALLDLLSAVGEAGAPWPTETRGCLVQRTDDRIVDDEAGQGSRRRTPTLLIDCAVDLLHWRELTLS